MAYPTSYTETTLAVFMKRDCLQGTANVIGWKDTDPDGDYQPAIDATLEAYGVADIADATDGVKLRALARLMVWSKVMEATAGYHNYTADGGTFSAESIHRQAASMKKDAQREAKPFLPPDWGRSSSRGGSVQVEAVPVW